MMLGSIRLSGGLSMTTFQYDGETRTRLTCGFFFESFIDVSSGCSVTMELSRCSGEDNSARETCKCRVCHADVLVDTAAADAERADDTAIKRDRHAATEDNKTPTVGCVETEEWLATLGGTGKVLCGMIGRARGPRL